MSARKPLVPILKKTSFVDENAHSAVSASMTSALPPHGGAKRVPKSTTKVKMSPISTDLAVLKSPAIKTPATALRVPRNPVVAHQAQTIDRKTMVRLEKDDVLKKVSSSAVAQRFAKPLIPMSPSAKRLHHVMDSNKKSARRVLRTPACQKTPNARTPVCVAASSPSTFEEKDDIKKILDYSYSDLDISSEQMNSNGTALDSEKSIESIFKNENILSELQSCGPGQNAAVGPVISELSPRRICSDIQREEKMNAMQGSSGNGSSALFAMQSVNGLSNKSPLRDISPNILLSPVSKRGIVWTNKDSDDLPIKKKSVVQPKSVRFLLNPGLSSSEIVVKSGKHFLPVNPISNCKETECSHLETKEDLNISAANNDSRSIDFPKYLGANTKLVEDCESKTHSSEIEVHKFDVRKNESSVPDVETYLDTDQVSSVRYKVSLHSDSYPKNAANGGDNLMAEMGDIVARNELLIKDEDAGLSEILDMLKVVENSRNKFDMLKKDLDLKLQRRISLVKGGCFDNRNMDGVIESTEYNPTRRFFKDPSLITNSRPGADSSSEPRLLHPRSPYASFGVQISEIQETDDCKDVSQNHHKSNFVRTCYQPRQDTSKGPLFRAYENQQIKKNFEDQIERNAFSSHSVSIDQPLDSGELRNLGFEEKQSCSLALVPSTSMVPRKFSDGRNIESIDLSPTIQLQHSSVQGVATKFKDYFLDSEVSIYTCSSLEESTRTCTRLSNPLATLFSHGDDKHFIPITSLPVEPGNSSRRST